MGEQTTERKLVEILAEEFVARYRNGERPALSEYCTAHPELAQEIQDLFPALVMMEELAPGDESSASVAAPSPILLAGLPRERLGDYRILREIGRGGMGVVYEAEQVSLGRHVALKVLSSHALLDPRYVQRFLREARSAARLHHNNIVPVYGVGEEEGFYYYVMQFIQGQGLDEVLVELQRLRQVNQVASLSSTRPDKDVSAADIAQGLLSGSFGFRGAKLESEARPESESEAQPESAKGVPVNAEPGPAPTPDVPSNPGMPSQAGSSNIHLPGQVGHTTLSDSSGRQYWQSVARIGVQVADALAYAAGQGILHRDIKPSNLLLDMQGTVWVTDFGLAKAETDQDNLTHTGDVIGTVRYMAPERFRGQADLRGDVYSLGLTLYELLTLRPAFAGTERNILFEQVMHDEPPRPRELNLAVPHDLETIVLKAIARDPARRYQTPAELADDLKRFVDDRPIRARRVGELERFWRWCRRNPAVSSLLAALVLVFVIGFVGVTLGWYKSVEERKKADLAKEEAQEAKRESDQTLYFSHIAHARLEYVTNNVAGARQVLDECLKDNFKPYRGWEWGYLKQLCHADLLTLRGHTADSWVWAVAYSPDGRLLASAGGGNPYYGPSSGPVKPGEVILWDMGTGERVRTLHGHQHIVRTVAFRPPAGKQMVSGDYDGLVKFWDVASGRELDTLSLGKKTAVNAVAFSPDGGRLATTLDGEVQVWDLPAGATRPKGQARIVQRGNVTGLAFSPNGQWLAVANGEEAGEFPEEVKVWDLARGTSVALELPAGAFRGVAFSPDSSRLAAAGREEVRLWELPTGRLLRILSGHRGFVQAVAFSADGTRLATAGDDTTVRVWDVGTGREKLLFRGHTHQVLAVAFSTDGTRVASAGKDQSVMLWDLLYHPELGTVDALNHPLEAIAFSADGRSLVAVSRERRMDTVDVESHTLVRHCPVALTMEWMTPAEPACLDAEGRWLAGIHGTDRRLAALWDTATGRQRALFRGHTLPLQHVVISTDGRRVATGARPAGRQGEVKVWDTATGKPLLELTEEGLDPARLALSPDGRRLALTQLVKVPTGKDPRESLLRLFDVDTGQKLAPASRYPDRLCGLAFNSEGTRLAAAGLYTRLVVVRDLATGEEKSSHQGPEEAHDVAFSPDGSRLAIAARPLIKLLDGATLKEVLILRGRSQLTSNTHGFNPRVRFSRNGQLAAICDDMSSQLSVWSLPGPGNASPAERLRAGERRRLGKHLDSATFSAPWRTAPNEKLFRFHWGWVQETPLSNAYEYLTRAGIHARLSGWDAVEADLQRAVAAAPGDLAVHNACAGLYASSMRWQQAAEYLDRCLALRPDDLEVRSRAALVYLQLRDREGYRRHCRELLQRYDPKDDPATNGQVVARTCLLTPETPVDRDRVLELAGRGLISPEQSDVDPWLPPQIRGLAEYRAGHFQEAAAWLRKSQEGVGKLDQAGKAFTTYVLAIAYHKLGRAGEARQVLDQARQALQQLFPEAEKGHVEDWQGWLLCQPVRTEAEDLLGRAIK
jgi:WD40 repeat protein/serine/threonine protein kinase/tetratricopeptide (TPR) repeat protein